MAEIKQAKFIDQTGQEKDAVFIGAEKAIFDDNGERLDHKMEERKKATGLVATDTSGIAGEAGLEVSLQVLIDSVAEKVVNELVTNSALTQTLANYMTKAMMSNVQINDQNKVPTSALAFAMNQAITQNKNAITQLNSETWIPNPLGKLYDGNAKNGDANSPTALIMSGYNISNAPGQYGLIILTLPYPATGYYAQICISVENTTTPTRIWIRSMEKSSWKDWRTL